MGQSFAAGRGPGPPSLPMEGVCPTVEGPWAGRALVLGAGAPELGGAPSCPWPQPLMPWRLLALQRVQDRHGQH